MQELSHLIVSLDYFKAINLELLKEFKEQFMLKSNNANIQDAGDFCKVFFKHEFIEEDFINKIREIYRTLRSNIEYMQITKFLSNVATLLNKEKFPHRFFK